MRKSKEIREEIRSLAIEAEGIYEAANRANRDMTSEEDTRFVEVTKSLIPGLEKDLKVAVEREQLVEELVKRDQQKNTVEQLRELAGGQINPVLPVNGVPVGDEKPTARIYQRNARLKAFKSEETAYNAGMWMRALVARLYNSTDKYAEAHVKRLGWPVSAAQTEGSGSAGGFTVPAPLSQTIIDVRETVGVARRTARIVPMTADTLDMPRRDSGLTVFYPAEAASITASDKVWSQINFVARKRAVANQISQELVDDSLISIVDDAVNEMAYALADREDAEYINGDGTSTFGSVSGLLDAIGAAGIYTAPTGRSTWADLVMEDFTSTMGLLPDKYGRMPAWICSRNFFYTVMYRLEAAAGGNTFQTIREGGNAGTFLGFPVFFTDKMPKSTAVSTISALFGTFEQAAIIADRQGIAMGRSDEFQFLNDLVTLKATSRYDIKVHAPGDGSNAGAYVALKTAAS